MGTRPIRALAVLTLGFFLQQAHASGYSDFPGTEKHKDTHKSIRVVSSPKGFEFQLYENGKVRENLGDGRKYTKAELAAYSAMKRNQGTARAIAGAALLSKPTFLPIAICMQASTIKGVSSCYTKAGFIEELTRGGKGHSIVDVKSAAFLVREILAEIRPPFMSGQMLAPGDEDPSDSDDLN